MKMRKPHHVPLSRQSIKILEEIRLITGSSGYVFPLMRSRTRPMSENTLNGALRRLGYASNEMTAHGFRAKATVNVADSGHTRLIYNSGNGANFIVSQPINDEPATVANGSTVAFSCNSPEQVEQFHDVAVANGGTSIEAAPGPRETASMGTIVLAYFRDPDGNKLCGIHFPK